MKVGPNLIPYIEIYSKWIKDLTLRTKTKTEKPQGKIMILTLAVISCQKQKQQQQKIKNLIKIKTVHQRTLS